MYRDPDAPAAELEPPNFIGEQRFDVGAGIPLTYALDQRAQSLIVETMPDGNGDMTGSVNIYLDGNITPIPWRVLQMGSSRVSPIPSAKKVLIQPQAGARGIVAVQMVRGREGFGIYSNSGGGGDLIYFPLEKLTDADITDVQVGQAVVWNGTAWVNETVSGAPFPLEDLTDVVVSDKIIGQTILWNGTDWVNGDFALANLSGVGLADPVTGQALVYDDGTWTNGVPEIGLDQLTDTENIDTATNGQVLTYNSEISRWIPASVSEGNPGGWNPVTWENAGGTEISAGVWEVTPPGVGTGAGQIAISDIAPTLGIGDTFELLGAFAENPNGPFIAFKALTSPSGYIVMEIGTSGGLVYFSDGGETITSPGEIFGTAYTTFRIRGTVISITSGGVVISWICELGGQILGGSDTNNSTFTGAFDLAICYYQSTGGSPTPITFYGWQYRVIPAGE